MRQVINKTITGKFIHSIVYLNCSFVPWNSNNWMKNLALFVLNHNLNGNTYCCAIVEQSLGQNF